MQAYEDFNFWSESLFDEERSQSVWDRDWQSGLCQNWLKWKDDSWITWQGYLNRKRQWKWCSHGKQYSWHHSRRKHRSNNPHRRNLQETQGLAPCWCCLWRSFYHEWQANPENRIFLKCRLHYIWPSQGTSCPSSGYFLHVQTLKLDVSLQQCQGRLPFPQRKSLLWWKLRCRWQNFAMWPCDRHNKGLDILQRKRLEGYSWAGVIRAQFSLACKKIHRKEPWEVWIGCEGGRYFQCMFLVQTS